MTVSNDARELQPKCKTIDLREQGKGKSFYAVMRTWPYHSLDQAKVYPELLTVRFLSEDFDRAVYLANAMATIIQIGHDVHRSMVIEVGEAKFDHVTRAAERPVVAA